MVYECAVTGWVTEKECRDCFQKNKRTEFNTIKICRRENVVSVESNNEEDE